MKLRGKNKHNQPDSDDSNDIEVIEDFGFNTNRDLPPLSTSDISHVGQPVSIAMPEAIKPIEPNLGYPVPVESYHQARPEPEPGHIQYPEPVYVEPSPAGYVHDEQPASAVTGADAAPQIQTTPELTHYPDEAHFTEEQERAIQMAAIGSRDTSLEFGEKSGFDHLAPPKKSAGKIILITFLIVLLTGLLGAGGWYFWWTQYATFEYELQPAVILDGQEISADIFLPDGERERGVTAFFQDPLFLPVPGPITVPLTLQYGLRSVDADANLYVLTPLAEMMHEYKNEAPDLAPADFITNSQIARNIPYSLTFIQNPLPLSEYDVGSYTFTLSLNGGYFDVVLNVADTTPPVATPVIVIAEIGDEVLPEEFLANIEDNSDIASVIFAGDNAGMQTIHAYQDQLIEVEITDIHGNSAVYGTSMSVLRNQIPPAFSSVPLSIESMVNKPIAYPGDVAAFDDFGREIEYSIDDRDVDNSVIGEYTVTYIAEDNSGLRTEIEAVLHIISIDPDEVNQWVDEKLEEIITADMTLEQKVNAIWNCVRGNLKYSSVIRDTEWTGSVYTAAHYAINNTTGTHYHFYALSEVMLTRAGIINIRIERSESVGTAHFWNLIYYDDSGWYHYDSTSSSDWISITALQPKFNQAQAEEMSELLSARNAFGKDGYYDFDKEKYPDIVPGIDLPEPEPEP